MLLLSFCLIILLRKVSLSQEVKSIHIEKFDNGFQVDIKVSEKILVKLNLSRSDKVTSEAPVYLASNPGSLVKLNQKSLNNFTMYQDLKSNAAFLMFPDQSLQGTFRLGNREFYLHPKTRTNEGRFDLEEEYTATTIEDNQSFKVPDHSFSHPIEITDDLMGYLINRAEKLDYVVEILIFIDYSIYQNWLITSEPNVDNNEEDAINFIRYYYSSVVNAMDLRYSSMKEKDLSIRIKLAGFVIATTKSSSSWTHNYLVRSGDGQVVVDSYKVLDDFPAWLQNNADNLPNFDNALIFTRLPLQAGFYDNGTPRYISGLANIEAVCNNQAISLNKEKAPFVVIGTASHDLAHNLGSLHDIYAKNRCQATDQYIMSPAPGVLTATTALNPFQFSPCSINYMRQYLGALHLMEKNCLIQTTNNPSLDGIPVNKPVGQFLSIDQQCQHLFGAESFYCAGMISDLKMCSSLLCHNPASGRCTTRTELRAANGTTCGDRKWCHLDSCTFHEEAPYASDSCLSGDYRGLDFNCKITISKSPHLCYDENSRMKCCAMCDFLKNQNSTCTYGDQIPFICNLIRNYDCYNVNIKEKCCDRCSKFRNIEISDCEYGDRDNLCYRMHPSICYRDSHTCCELCLANKINYTDCEYGDMAEWCSDMNKALCNASVSVSNVCCIKCKYPWEAKNPLGLGPNVSDSGAPTGAGSPTDKTLDCPFEVIWCRNMPAFACYETRIERMCFCRCGKHVISAGNQDCRYGDKKSWCKLVKKENCPYVKDPSDCCLSCSREKTSQADLTYQSTGISTYVSTVMTTRALNKEKIENLVLSETPENVNMTVSVIRFTENLIDSSSYIHYTVLNNVSTYQHYSTLESSTREPRVKNKEIVRSFSSSVYCYCSFCFILINLFFDY